jgi:hypothetical protein
MNPNLVAALKIPHLQAQSRDAIYAAAAARQQQAARDYGFQSQSDFESRGVPAGYSGEAILAAAQAYAQGRSYGGGGYEPHAIMQEGHVEYQNGQPGVYIKYSTPGGSTTEWTPI